MGGMGIFWEANRISTKALQSPRGWKDMLLAQRGQRLTVSCKKKKKNSRMVGRNQRWFSRDDIAQRQETNEDKWVVQSKYNQVLFFLLDQGFWLKITNCGWRAVSCTLSESTQYFIMLGVNRLNRSDGWFVLTIHRTVHKVHTAKGQRLFLILSIDWKDWSKTASCITQSSGRGLRREAKKKKFRQKENN